VVSYLGDARLSRDLKPPQGYVDRDTLEQAFRWIEDSVRDHLAEDIHSCRLVKCTKAHGDSREEAAHRQKRTRPHTLQAVTKEEDRWCLDAALNAVHNAGDFDWSEIFWLKQMRRLRNHRLASTVVYRQTYIVEVIDHVQEFARWLGYTAALKECDYAKTVVNKRWDARLWAQLEDRRVEMEEETKAAQLEEDRLEAEQVEADLLAAQPPYKKRRTQ
jgi:hypothetical protein